MPILSSILFTRKEIKRSYLAGLGPLTDVCFIHGSKSGSIVVYVQQADVDWNMAALTWIIWKVNTKRETLDYALFLRS